MIGVVLQRGDHVVIEGQVPAMVTLASPNGRSLVLMFDAVLDITGTGLIAAGSLCLSMVEDGRYVELVTGAVIQLERPA